MDFGFSGQPRGLQNFISDIRNAKSKEDERMRVEKELANIRQKFSVSAALTSYDKKKYVWKLCYIYMLGYEVDFGHVEFISLLSSTKFQEKSVGYMAFSLMFRSGDELMTLAVNSMRNDIVGQLLHGQTLALAAVSNMGGSSLAEALAPDVQRLVLPPSESRGTYGLSPDQDYRNKALVCKKAAMCLLRLFRTNPDCLILEDWLRKLAKLLEDRDLGVVTSVMSLLLGFASNQPAIFEPLVPYIISILTRLVVSRTCTSDYLFYSTPTPWLQVKCLRFLQYYKIPNDHTQLDLLSELLQKILVRPPDMSESINKNNADNSILFEAMNLIILYGTECPEVIRGQARSLLGHFISVTDANIRYLSIDAMTRIAKLEGAVAVETHQAAVLESLKDPDISLRKRALNLLYVMAYERNAKDIVGELVINLPIAESIIKEDIVVKTAILAEKYSTDYKWYIDTMIQVIQAAGDYVAEAVWYRVVQIIVNNAEIHEYAAEKMLGLVQSKFAHDIIISVAGYLLGEIGVNICDKPGMTGYDQFAALHQHFVKTSVRVQCLLLTTYIKFVNLYPEQTKDLILDVFTKYTTSTELELQQRACEYLALSGVNPTTIETVLNVMPAFEIEKKENILLAIEASDSKSADRPAWSVDAVEKEASRQAYTEARTAELAELEQSQNPPPKPKRNPSISNPSPAASAPAAVPATVDLLSLDDDYSGGASGAAAASSSGNNIKPQLLQQMPALLKKACLVRGTTARSALLEDSSLLTVEYAGEFRAHAARLAIFLINNSQFDISNVTLQLPSSEALSAKLNVQSIARIGAGEEQRVLVAVDCLRPFADSPVLEIVFQQYGSPLKYSIPLPVTPISFCSPLPCDKNTYMTRWKAITAEKTESQQVFASGASINEDLMAHIRNALMPSMQVGQAEGLDNERTFTGCTSFVTGTPSADGKPIAVGALMRLEADYNTNKFRITVRATHPVVSQAIKDFIVQQLS